MPNRGVLTALSPHEEVTLRRVAIGIAKLADLPARDIERLKVLLLVEENGGGLRLTPAGRERYLALPNSAGIFKPGTANENWFQRWPGWSRKVGARSNMSPRRYLADLRLEPSPTFDVPPSTPGGKPMNSIVYIVGLVVIIGAVLAFLGLR